MNLRGRIFYTLFALVVSAAASQASGEEIAVARFGSSGLAEWNVKEFKGQTDYRLVEKNGRTVLHAYAQAAASGLIREIPFDPRHHRYLNWSWKIAHTVPGGDARTKRGDDYAARVYVIFPGRFFWQTRALNYIWANQLPQGESIANAFTSNARMLAVQSGNDKAGQWVDEQRDILADYRRLFGEDPPRAGAIAIMTDTDNTGAEAWAWYGDITLTSAP